MSFHVKNPSKTLLKKVLGLIPNDESMKYIAGIDRSRHQIDFRVGSYTQNKLGVGFVLIPDYEGHYETHNLKEVKENDVTLEMICEALGIKVPKQSVLAWGYKDKETGDLDNRSYPTRDYARIYKNGSEKIIRVRITEL